MKKPNINKSNLNICYNILGIKATSSQVGMREKVKKINDLLRFKYGLSNSKEVEKIRKLLNIPTKSRTFLKLYRDNIVYNKQSFDKDIKTFYIEEVSKKEAEETKINNLIEDIQEQLSEQLLELI